MTYPRMTIYRRLTDGQVIKIIPGTPEGSYISNSVCMAYEMLNYEGGLKILQNIALKYDEAQQTRTIDDNLAAILVDLFMSSFQESLPTVIIDDGLAHGASHGYHMRFPSPFADFKPYRHSVYVNGAVSLPRKSLFLAHPILKNDTRRN